MKRLTAKEIKKILLGVVLSDGYIDQKGNRFELYSKSLEYAEFITGVIQQISGMSVRLSVKNDKRGYIGYRVSTKSHPYWNNMKQYVYKARKNLNSYNVARLDEQSLAHIWMCDGYLEHAKNRKLGKVQNIGWFCLEAFPKEELELFQNRLKEFGIESSLTKKPWGFGYRVRIGGINLQRFISLIYQFVLPSFNHKTILFYKEKESADMSLSNAKHYIQEYECIEDIVRHPLKKGIT